MANICGDSMNDYIGPPVDCGCEYDDDGEDLIAICAEHYAELESLIAMFSQGASK